MANHKSAAKRHLQSEKRRIQNRAARSALRTQIKKARADLQSGAQTGVTEAVQALAKAGGKGLMHKKTAARRISRLMKAANKVAAQKA